MKYTTILWSHAIKHGPNIDTEKHSIDRELQTFDEKKLIPTLKALDLSQKLHAKIPETKPREV